MISLNFSDRFLTWVCIFQTNCKCMYVSEPKMQTNCKLHTKSRHLLRNNLACGFRQSRKLWTALFFVDPQTRNLWNSKFSKIAKIAQRKSNELSMSNRTKDAAAAEQQNTRSHNAETHQYLNALTHEHRHDHEFLNEITLGGRLFRRLAAPNICCQVRSAATSQCT